MRVQWQLHEENRSQQQHCQSTALTRSRGHSSSHREVQPRAFLMDVGRYTPHAGCLLTQISFSASFSLCQSACSVPSDPVTAATVSQALPKQLLLLVLQSTLRYGTHPQNPHGTVEHGLWAQDRPRSSCGVEPAQLFGQAAATAKSLWVGAGSPVLHGALAHLVLPPELLPGLPQSPTNPPVPRKTPHSTEGPGKGGGGRKVQCCDGKASQHQDLKPTMALPGLGQQC